MPYGMISKYFSMVVSHVIFMACIFGVISVLLIRYLLFHVLGWPGWVICHSDQSSNMSHTPCFYELNPAAAMSCFPPKMPGGRELEPTVHKKANNLVSLKYSFSPRHLCT